MRSTTRLVVVFATMIGLALAAVGPATGSDASITVKGGVLGIDAPVVSDVVVEAGTTVVSPAPMGSFSVTDARGSGQGWRLSIHATPFREWDGAAYAVPATVLEGAALGLPGVSVTAEGTDSAAPEVIAGSHIIDEAGVVLAVAQTGAGMGRFTFTPTGPLTITVPRDSTERSYRSELWISVTSGP